LFPRRVKLLQSRKQENHDALCEELFRERAAVLSRAGMAVEEALAGLAKLDQDIQIKIEQLQSLKLEQRMVVNLPERQILSAEINAGIDQFNAVLKNAQLKYYYLIVTREALGLRRHDRIQEIYPLPVKKKKIQVF
jgi:hypothetical protein